MLADHLVEDVPDFRLLLLDQLLGLLDRGREALGVEPRIDERLEQLERHLLRQPALVQLELGTNHDHRAAGIVDALAQEVLPEAALLSLEHVGERLQRPLVGAGDDAPAPAVVEQRVDRLLQHPLFIADDDVGRAQLDQPLQAVVAVDDAAIEIVQIGGGEAAAVERHERPQIRRDHRHLRQDHPFRLVAGLLERLDDLEPLGDLLLLDVGIGGRDLRPQVGLHLVEIERLEHLADGLRADRGGEAVAAELLLRLEILVLAQQLVLLERGQSRLQHHVALEIQDALERLERHVEQEPDARGQRLEEPDVGDRRGELDVPHSLAPHARERDLDRALLADDALVLHALVLAAQALVILDRPEDARAEQAVALGLEGAVVDGLRLLDLAVGPRQNLFRARDRDPDLVEDLSRRLRAEKIHDLLIHRLLRMEYSVVRGRTTDVARQKARHPHLSPFPLRLFRPPLSVVRYSAPSDASPPGPVRCCFELCRSTLRPSERISLTSTLNDSGMPASNVSSPRTIASYTLVRPATSSDFTVSISCSVYAAP